MMLLNLISFYLRWDKNLSAELDLNVFGHMWFSALFAVGFVCHCLFDLIRILPKYWEKVML